MLVAAYSIFAFGICRQVSFAELVWAIKMVKIRSACVFVLNGPDLISQFFLHMN